MIKDDFRYRHIGPNQEETKHMLNVVGVSSMEELIDKTIPSSIRLEKPLSLPEGLQEGEYLTMFKKMMSKNKLYSSYIGLGQYNTRQPQVNLRNIFENLGWYSSYTPDQA